MLTILRDTDLPELAALLAPRRLTFVPCQPEAFGHVQSVYKLLGAEQNLAAVASVADALFSGTMGDNASWYGPQC